MAEPTLAQVNAWCSSHRQSADLCGLENRNCDHGRQSPPPDPAVATRQAGGWGDGPRRPDPPSLSDGTSGATLFTGRHIAVRPGDTYRCTCGATFNTASDALHGTHR